MSDRRLSKRSQRRLRVKVARLVAEEEVKGRRESTHQLSGGSDQERHSDGADCGVFTEAGDQATGSSSEGELDDCDCLSGGENLSDCADLHPSEQWQCASGSGSDLSDGGGFESEDEGQSSDDSLSEVTVSSEDSSEICDVGEELPSIQSGAPLFPAARVTTTEFNLAFMSLTQRHNLTYASQTALEAHSYCFTGSKPSSIFMSCAHRQICKLQN